VEAVMATAVGLEEQPEDLEMLGMMLLSAVLKIHLHQAEMLMIL